MEKKLNSIFLVYHFKIRNINIKHSRKMARIQSIEDTNKLIINEENLKIIKEMNENKKSIISKLEFTTIDSKEGGKCFYSKIINLMLNGKKYTHISMDKIVLGSGVSHLNSKNAGAGDTSIKESNIKYKTSAKRDSNELFVEFMYELGINFFLGVDKVKKIEKTPIPFCITKYKNEAEEMIDLENDDHKVSISIDVRCVKTKPEDTPLTRYRYCKTEFLKAEIGKDGKIKKYENLEGTAEEIRDKLREFLGKNAILLNSVFGFKISLAGAYKRLDLVLAKTMIEKEGSNEVAADDEYMHLVNNFKKATTEDHDEEQESTPEKPEVQEQEQIEETEPTDNDVDDL